MRAERRDRVNKVQSLSMSNAPMDKVTMVTNFLKDNYHIEINKFDHTQMRIKSIKRPYQFSPLVDDISLHMMQEGIPHTRSLIKMILNSPNQTKTFDPMKDYFESLRSIKPEISQIDLLIAHLKVREFDDHDSATYYNERAACLIRKWLVATVACAMGQHANEAALIFIGAEGNGKTSLARFLCPEPLHEMFAVSSSDRRSYNIDQAITSSFMILYDEMSGLNPTVAEDFKKALSARQMAVRMKGDLCPILRPRIGSIIGTTNNRTGVRVGFLHPSMGTRRFICIHLEEINFKYLECVDRDELWAEALALSENPDYDYRLSQEDYAEFDDVNRRYMLETPASALLQQVFVIPREDSDDDTWLTPTEIVAELRALRLIKAEAAKHLTPQHVGEAMRSLGYTRRMIYDDGKRQYKYKIDRI